MHEDFSTNRHHPPQSPTTSQAHAHCLRHPTFSFDDGNLALIAQDHYFLVHQGLLSRHSPYIANFLKSVDTSSPLLAKIQGRPAIRLEDTADDVCLFLTALYDGVSSLRHDPANFATIAAILRLCTKYGVRHLREELIRGLSAAWPTTLAQWEVREAGATSASGVYEPRKTIPHPILVINFAQEIGAPELIPSAFYDLSRSTPSDATAGHLCLYTGQMHQLKGSDLMALLKGREHASRFLSTFIVSHLEGRTPSAHCLYRRGGPPTNPEEHLRARTCQSAFEAVTFEILRDVNGVVCHRSSDPLFAMVDAELMQSRGDRQDLRTCEACRQEFGAAVDTAREEFWRLLPKWFGVEVLSWG
ncbi:hypothetical protein FISHEDRAFT_65004 [Fistulina hepatica ATCC 64428]|uniref:BTB domain-containing protein n=1 Tax=Fistulina hepatica ATCC 64428 TaxID=1128425 RepID=A0A0D7AGI6_9AGAR|nr:hypothetical protein FISHEDRAFT_65004 [Fistulina hepatica ATCC 64428]